MSEPKIFSPPITAGVSPVVPPVESAKTVGEVTDNAVAQYAAAPGETAKPTRKPRSDRGRPRGPRNLAGDAAQGQALDSAQAGAAIGYTVDKKIVERTALAVLKTVDAAVIRRVGNTALKLGAELGDAKSLAQDASLTQTEAELMGELTGVVFEKNGLLTGYAPELLLGIMLSEWGIRVVFVLKRLDHLAGLKKAKNADTPSPDKNSHIGQVGER